VTDTIDPAPAPGPAEPEPHRLGPPLPKPGGTWTNGGAQFVRGDRPEEDASAPPPQRSKALPALALLAVAVLIVRSFGWWGMFIVAGLLVSVTLHELGHYLAARQAGMKVTEFFVGVGPRLFSFHRGEVEYGIKAAPIAAYVRIVGMSDLEDVDSADEGRTYREKSYWARLRVVLAGPFVNFAIGFLVLTVLYMSFGVATNHGWKVDAAEGSSAAAAAGLRSGDKLISYDGKPFTSFDKFGNDIKRAADEPVTMVVERGGQRLTLHATIGWNLDDAGAAPLAPLEAGDRITKVGATATATYAAVRNALADAPKGETTLQVLRNGDRYRLTVATPLSLPADGSRGFLGISASPKVARQGPVQAVGTAGSQFASLVGGSVEALGRFFSPSGLANWTKYVFTDKGTTTTTSSSSGSHLIPINSHTPPATSDQPVSTSAPENNRILSVLGVLRLGSQAGSEGLAVVLFILALINIFLGLLNLVPLPPFDGGHAAVATYEAIREKLSGRPYRADMAKLIPVTYAMMALIVFIAVSSLYLDAFHPAANPFKGP
jgi:RIP metalloprotease RseP